MLDSFNQRQILRSTDEKRIDAIVRISGVGRISNIISPIENFQPRHACRRAPVGSRHAARIQKIKHFPRLSYSRTRACARAGPHRQSFGSALRGGTC